MACKYEECTVSLDKKHCFHLESWNDGHSKRCCWCKHRETLGAPAPVIPWINPSPIWITPLPYMPPPFPNGTTIICGTYVGGSTTGGGSAGSNTSFSAK